MSKTKEVKGSWDSVWDYRFKKTYSPPVYDFVWKTVERYIPKSGNILDAGCGDGEYSKKITKINPAVVSMDLSSVVLKKLKGTINSVLLGEVSHLPLKSQFFDVLISLSVLEYVEDPKKTIVEFERALKPGGHLIISVPNMTSLYTLQRKLTILLGRYIYYKNIILYSADSLRELFFGTKFNVEFYDYDVLYFNVLNKILGRETGGKIIQKLRQVLPEFIRSNLSHYIICVAKKS